MKTLPPVLPQLPASSIPRISKVCSHHSVSIFSIAILCLIAMTGCFSGHSESSKTHHFDSESELRDLNHALADANTYQKRKIAKADSLKALLPAADNVGKCNIYHSLSELYRQMNADSALNFAIQALSIAPAESTWQKTRASLDMANAMSTAGLFLPAYHTLDSISHEPLSESGKIEFWKSSRILYSYMLAYVHDQGTLSDHYRAKYITCDDSLIAHLPPTDLFARFIKCERMVANGRMEQAKTDLESLMSQLSPESNIYGMAAYQLAGVYKSRGDFRQYGAYLAKAAESDIRGCVKEGLALPTLANWLYEHGELDDAFRYINFALEDANSGNIRMRVTSIATMMPVIDNAYRSKINSSKNQILVYLIISSSLFVVVAIFLIALIGSYRKIRLNEKKLASSSKKLEAYVGNFIGLCSNYSSRLDQLMQLVTRKLSSGQANELQKIISSGKFSEKDDEEFYHLIDKALLDILPDFTSTINTLLRPDSQIELKDDDPLTPELRIYAFVRLGVDQSARIAQILNYSINTVYSYRNRMRKRAIDPNGFDAHVARLGGHFEP